MRCCITLASCRQSAANCVPESCIAWTRPPADCWWWPKTTKRIAGWPASSSRRQVKKKYIALVHGWLKQDRGTISSSISRDRVRRTRMTTRGPGGREAITHYQVERRLDSPYGKFTLLEVQIDTGRTHQIRVHLASLRHPVVGDTLYGAPREIRSKAGRPPLASAEIFCMPRRCSFSTRAAASRCPFRPLPAELEDFLQRLGGRLWATSYPPL